MRVNEGPKNYYAIPLSPRRFCSYEQLFLNCGLTFKTRFQTGRRETYCPFRRNLTTLSPKLYQSHPGLISKSGRSSIKVSPDLDQSPGGVVSKPPPTCIQVRAELYQRHPRLVSKSGRSYIKVTPGLYPSPGGVVSKSPPACIQVRVELPQCWQCWTENWSPWGRTKRFGGSTKWLEKKDTVVVPFQAGMKLLTSGSVIGKHHHPGQFHRQSTRRLRPWQGAHRRRAPDFFLRRRPTRDF